MDIAAYRSQDTKAWPGKIAVVVIAGSGNHSVREIEAELQKSFTTNAVVFEGEIEKQSDLPIVAKKMKLKNKLIRVNTNGSNTDMLRKMIERRVVDYISLAISSEKELDDVRDTVVLIERSKVPHEIVLKSDRLTEEEIKRVASSVTGTFVLYGEKPFDELRAVAQQLTGSKHVRIRNKGGEQSIS